MSTNKNHQSAIIMCKKAALHFYLVPREAGFIQSQRCVCMCLRVCDCSQRIWESNGKRSQNKLSFYKCHENRCLAKEMDLD